MISAGMKLILWLPVISLCAQVQDPEDQLKYLKQTRPSLKPEVFAPGLISKPAVYEYGSVFSKSGTEFFFAVALAGRAEILQSKLIKGTWSSPKTIISHEVYGFNDPFLSPDENELYYISNSPLKGKGAKKDHDIWYSIRQADGWSKPINAGPAINSDHQEYYISFTDNKTMYFASNAGPEKQGNGQFDIYASTWVGGVFQKPQLLSPSINTKHYEADVFVAQDESYVIYCSIRPQGLGQGDLYISFKLEDGTWSQAKNMGDRINSKHHELCPFVTVDGKYLFFTSNKDIYWVDASIIDSYR